MFKFVAILALASIANAGILPAATFVHEPVVANVGAVVHSVPLAVSHQSITQVHHNNAVVQPVLAPVVKTTVNAAPIVPSVPVVHAAPVIKTYAAAPVVHALSVVKTVPSVPIV